MRLSGRLAIPAVSICIIVGLVWGATPESSATPAPANAKTQDDEFAQIALQVPSFGGAYIDEASGALYVFTTSSSLPDALAVGHLLDNVYAGGGLGSMRVVPLSGRFSFGQLRAWNDKVIRTILAMPGTILADIDDRNNRLRIGSESLTNSKSTVEKKLSEMGIPVDAVSIEEVPPIRTQNSLNDYHRPLVGGLQISYPDVLGVDIFTCTLGFNAIRYGAAGFVTNSHCSTTQGEVDGDNFFQPDPILFFDHGIGTETDDPALFTGPPCPSERRCRYSDSLFSTFVCFGPGCDTTRYQGYIALVGGNPSWNGSSKYRIRHESSPIVGERVCHTGITTGRQCADVSAIGVAVNVLNTDITMLDQARAPYISDNGDSGGPITRVYVNPTDVTLKGIHWGSGGYFSIMADIQNFDLGPLQTCAPGFSC